MSWLPGHLQTVVLCRFCSWRSFSKHPVSAVMFRPFTIPTTRTVRRTPYCQHPLWSVVSETDHRILIIAEIPRLRSPSSTRVWSKMVLAVFYGYTTSVTSLRLLRLQPAFWWVEIVRPARWSLTEFVWASNMNRYMEGFERAPREGLDFILVLLPLCDLLQFLLFLLGKCCCYNPLTSPHLQQCGFILLTWFVETLQNLDAANQFTDHHTLLCYPPIQEACPPWLNL